MGLPRALDLHAIDDREPFPPAVELGCCYQTAISTITPALGASPNSDFNVAPPHPSCNAAPRPVGVMPTENNVNHPRKAGVA